MRVSQTTTNLHQKSSLKNINLKSEFERGLKFEENYMVPLPIPLPVGKNIWRLNLEINICTFYMFQIAFKYLKEPHPTEQFEISDCSKCYLEN